MMPESGPDEMVIIEEQVGPVPSGLASRRTTSPARIASMVVGSLALSLAATAIAIRLANRGRVNRGRRRVPLFNMQPRVAVFAPSMTITLPFSGISGPAAPRRPAAVRSVRFPRGGRLTTARAVRFPRGGRSAGAHVPDQANRKVAGIRAWLPRPARRPAAR